jgi:DNA-binding transcriptional LysR family regulator
LANGAIYRWEFERRGKKIEVDVPGRISLDDTSLMHEAALAGMGLTYLSVWQVASDVKSGRLVQVLDDWTPAFPGLCLYYPGRRHVPLGLRALIELIRELKAKSSLP